MATRRRRTLTQRDLLLGLLNVLWRHPWLGVALLAVLGGLDYAYEVQIARPTLVYLGEPRVQNPLAPLTWNRTLRNHGFLLGYSDLRGNPLWVSYRVSPPSAQAPHLPRPERFQSDWRALNRVSHEDYSNSGYDRGHMAPNRALSLLYGRSAQLDTFLLTNITPQRPDLNRQVWERLEAAELEQFAPRFGTVWVLTGPVFDAQRQRLAHAWSVEIPDAFYKIYAVPQAQAAVPARILAVLIPQSVRADSAAEPYLTTVDEIERQTGLDFFPELPTATAALLESRIDRDGWELPGVGLTHFKHPRN